MSAGLLAVWNAIPPEDEADFNAWYDDEHLPERLALPGFLAARRYRSQSRPQHYCALYDTESPQSLSSPAYLERLANPTPATREIMAKFRDMHRAVCAVAIDVGPLRAPGRALAIVELGDTGAADVSPERAASIAQRAGLRVRLATPDASITRAPNPEQRLRVTPDALPSSFLLIEGDAAHGCAQAAADLAPGKPAMSFALLYAKRRDGD